MEKIKKVGILLVFLILSAFSLQAYEAEDYARSFQSVSFKGKGASVVGRIELSDGLVLKWTPNDFEAQMLSSWQVDDPMFLVVHARGWLLLINENSDIFYAPRVTLDKEVVNTWPAVKKVVKLKLPRDSYSSEKQQQQITLSDGSCWVLECFVGGLFDDDIKRWKVGDKVLVQTDIDGDMYLFNYRLAVGAQHESAIIPVDPYSD